MLHTRKISLLLLHFLAVITAFAQSDSTSLREDAPKVFLDCNYYCDRDFIRQNINYVNFVRDRALADVYILQTGIGTGGGGDKFELFYYGQERFANMNDTSQFFTEADDTEGEIRDMLLAKLKIGLLPYVLKTTLANKVTFSVGDSETDGNKDATNVKDPWNFWTFSTRMSGFFNGESLYNNSSINGNFRASRVTEKNKIAISFGLNYNESNFFDTDDEGKKYLYYQGINRSQFSNANYIHSLTDHWSAGVFGGVSSATFNNLKLARYINAGIEYNIFPYAEATRRQLTFRYTIGPNINRYVDSTVFDKIQEVLLRHDLGIGYSQVQKWGSVSLNGGVGNYLHDFKLNSFYINPNVSWNAFKGFNLEFGGYGSLINDQISLSKVDLDPGEFFTRIRQFGTNYSYFGYLSMNYTFGSIYNNVVNPRMSGDGGSFSFNF